MEHKLIFFRVPNLSSYMRCKYWEVGYTSRDRYWCADLDKDEDALVTVEEHVFILVSLPHQSLWEHQTFRLS